jgi:hypothetical protein
MATKSSFISLDLNDYVQFFSPLGILTERWKDLLPKSRTSRGVLMSVVFNKERDRSECFCVFSEQ